MLLQNQMQTQNPPTTPLAVEATAVQEEEQAAHIGDSPSHNIRELALQMIPEEEGTTVSEDVSAHSHPEHSSTTESSVRDAIPVELGTNVTTAKAFKRWIQSSFRRARKYWHTRLASA